MESIVALDLETTGLDPLTDMIIEIGAVRFNDRRVEAEFSTLINPGRPIPPVVVNLTGITDQMVRSQPPIAKVLADLREFVGSSPVLGHNVRFDLGFMRRHRLFTDNEAIDTYELASVLMPGASRYNLGSLGAQLSIPHVANHRALDDAKVCRLVYLKLLEMGKELPLNVIAEIVRHGEGLNWDAARTFQRILKMRSKEPVQARSVRSGPLGPLFDNLNGRGQGSLTPNPELYALNVDEVSAILEHGGSFSQAFPNYEYRPQQVEMLRAVTEAFNQSHHLLVEAGTGTGKSLAYLIPSVLWAMQNGTRVIISTNTINLQEQLVKKDIPDLRKALEIDLQAVVLKGRSNYLCPRRLESMHRRGPETTEEMRVYAKILTWLQSSVSGDRSEINLNGPVERDVWARLSAEDDNCSGETCLKKTGGACPFYRIKQAAQAAHVIIVNHALLLADVATGSRVLPEYSYLVIDEAHHMEEAITGALGYSTSQTAIEHLLRELGGANSGSLGRLLVNLQSIIQPSDYAAAVNMVGLAADHAYHFQDLSKTFFSAIEHFLSEQRDGRPFGSYAQQERVLPATRSQPSWMQVEVAWDDADQPLKALLENLTRLESAMADVRDMLEEDGLEAASTLTSITRRFGELQGAMTGMVFNPEPDTIYWVELSGGGRRISLNTAPLHVGPLMQRHLWHEKSAVIMTSATMTAAGEFDYIRGRLAAEDAYEMAVGSPYDYESSAMLYIANDVPEPADKGGHQRAIEQNVLHLAQATGGRMLVLFTSYDQLKRTSQAISSHLLRNDIRVYEQGDGASPHALLENFRADGRAVLLGTRSFWEGVDLPGDTLQVIVIAKLPFDVPSDPIIAARSETFEDSFNQYSLPEAILRFRQGFGRLIRSQADRGIVAILDKRILTKKYGRLFLDSLPQCTTRVGASADLPKAAKQWLNL